MAPQLGAALSYCCGEGWQCDCLGSFDGPLQLDCVFTILFEWVAQHTTLHDLDTWSGLFWFMRSTTISVMVVYIATGTLSDIQWWAKLMAEPLYQKFVTPWGGIV